MDQRRSLIIIAIITFFALVSGFFTASAQEEGITEVPAPEAPEAEYPQGDLISKSVGFYWVPSQNADHYEVNWEDSWGGKGSDELDAGDASCEAGRCVLYAELPVDGAYTWTVTAVNDAGNAVCEPLSFNVLPVLQAPDAYRPNTALGIGKTLTFEWEDTGENASEFRIQAAESDTDRICLDQWFTAAGIYAGGGVRSMKTNLYLPTGSYRWRVQAKNDTAISGWSRWTEFSVTCAECTLGTYTNTTSAVLSPIGTITDPSPVFEWLNVTGAYTYVLKVSDAAGTEVLNETIAREACDYMSCSYQSPSGFAAGQPYTWSVSTHGYNNVFWGSGEGSFTVNDTASAPAGRLSFILPKEGETLNSEDPEIIWNDPGDPNGTFTLAIIASDGEILLYSDLTREDAWCDGKTCSIRFRTIPAGDSYQILLAEYSEFNIPGAPAVLTFNVK